MTTTLMKVVFSKDFPGLGERIRKLRKKSHKDLTALAAEAGISSTHWNRIENEKVRELPIETLRGIERALGATFGAEYDEKDS